MVSIIFLYVAGRLYLKKRPENATMAPVAYKNSLIKYYVQITMIEVKYNNRILDFW